MGNLILKRVVYELARVSREQDACTGS